MVQNKKIKNASKNPIPVPTKTPYQKNSHRLLFRIPSLFRKNQIYCNVLFYAIKFMRFHFYT